MVFWATAGYSLLKWALKPGSPDFDKNNSFASQPSVTKEGMPDIPRWKGTMSVVVLVGRLYCLSLCGFAPFNKYFNIANIALLGATILLQTGCVPVKSTLAELPWDVLICIGAITGLGTGLDASGGGAIIAGFVLNLFGGESASVIVLTVVITILTSVLTLFMQNGDGGGHAYANLYFHGAGTGNQPCSMGCSNCNRYEPCHCIADWNCGEHADSSGRLYVQRLCENWRTTVHYHGSRRVGIKGAWCCSDCTYGPGRK